MPESQSLVARRYRLLQPLGSGGFGDTFLARDEQLPSGRQVVVKRLRPIRDDEPTRQTVETAFLREASVLEDVGRGHAQIPELFAYFQEEDAFWLVQEYIPGPTLQSLGRIDSRQAINLLQNLLPVLDHLHSRGILHRDIKPENIILRQSDRKPVLIDFGAVRESMAAVQLPSGSIRSTVVIGTQGFMAPEQAAGRPIFSSDLYALALTVIAMLTGENPQELPADPVTGLLQWHSAAAETDPALVTILDRAMQANPALRYPSAREMLAVLPSSNAQPRALQATVVVAPVAQPNPFPALPEHDTTIVAPLAPTEAPATGSAYNTVVIAPVQTNEPAASPTVPTITTASQGSASPSSPSTSELLTAAPTRVVASTSTQTRAAGPTDAGPRYSTLPIALVGVGLATVTGTSLAILLGHSDLRCRLLTICTAEVSSAAQTRRGTETEPAASSVAPLSRTLEQAASLRQLNTAIEAVKLAQAKLSPAQKAVLAPALQQAQDRLVAESEAQAIVDRAREQLDELTRSDSAPAGREQRKQIQQQLATVSRQRFAYPQAQQVLQRLATVSTAAAPIASPAPNPANEPPRQPAAAAPTGTSRLSTSRPGNDDPLWGDSKSQPGSPSDPLW